MDTLTATVAEAAVRLVTRQSLATTDGSSNPGGKSDAQYAIQGRYNYAPSFAAAVIFLILFAACTIANLFLIFRHRAWFWWSMTLGVMMELVGYTARAVSIKNLDSSSDVTYIIQLVFTLVAPAVMAAGCYQAFGRIVLWVTPPQYQTARHLWLPARRITPLFVGFDVFSFFVQVIGGSIIAGAKTTAKENTGKNVILVGLGIQMVTFGFFVLASVRFAVVLRTKLVGVELPRDRNWRLFLRVVNTASVVILIRTVARFVEFIAGVHNYMSDHEWYFYTFDSALMFLVAVTFIVIHPGQYLPYLGIRRKYLEFSKNADRGFFSRFARGSDRMVLPENENMGTSEMYSRA